MSGYQSFMKDLAALVRRKREDAGQRSSLFEGVSPGNVGNVFEIAPTDVAASAANPSVYGRPVRVLEIVGEDALGEMICVSIQHERILDTQESANVVTGVTDRVEGPLVGIVEFGAGAGLASFEFDITTPVIHPGLIRFFDQVPATFDFFADLSVSRRNNGVMLSLPASSMRVFLRNDANAPFLIDLPGNPHPLNTFKGPAKVRVHATYGRRVVQSKLTRTLPICMQQTTNGAGPTPTFQARSNLVMGIPAYAERVWFPRAPLNTTTLRIQFIQTALTNFNGAAGGQFYRGPIIVPAGSAGPVEIEPLDSFIQIENPNGGTSIENMAARFDLAI